MPVDVCGADWNDCKIAQLRDLWIEGHTTAEIGRRLGLSKNAIIGKAHRLDLPARKSPIKRGNEAVPRSVPRLSRDPKSKGGRSIRAGTAQFAEPAPPLPCDPPRIEPHTIRRMLPQSDDERCCWPLGEPRTAGFRFCGEPAFVGKPYCPEHVQSAHQSPGNCERGEQPKAKRVKCKLRSEPSSPSPPLSRLPLGRIGVDSRVG